MSSSADNPFSQEDGESLERRPEGLSNISSLTHWQQSSSCEPAKAILWMLSASDEKKVRRLYNRKTQASARGSY